MSSIFRNSNRKDMNIQKRTVNEHSVTRKSLLDVVNLLRNVEMICMHNAGIFLYCNKKMLDSSYGSTFLYFDF